MTRLATTLAVAAVAAAALYSAVPAVAASVHVHPGQSIQAAIDAAGPGDTIVVDPGVYEENLTITKDHLTVRGAGIGQTVLEPAAVPNPSPCTDGDEVMGICVIGDGSPVAGTRISGFTISGFSGYGVLLLHADDSVVSDTEASGNAGYGISGFVLSGVRYLDDVAHDNGEPGFYIGDSPNARALVRGNRAYDNGTGGAEGDGILIRDSSHGVVVSNRVWANCLGINFVDSGENPAPLTGWKALGNRSTENDRACSGEMGGAPPLSGIGILLGGSDHVLLAGNVVDDNTPGGFSAIPSGGIVVVSTAMIGGADPTNNTVVVNAAHGNSPYDVFWDETGSGNTFSHNFCGSSQPSFICQ